MDGSEDRIPVSRNWITFPAFLIIEWLRSTFIFYYESDWFPYSAWWAPRVFWYIYGPACLIFWSSLLAEKKLHARYLKLFLQILGIALIYLCEYLFYAEHYPYKIYHNGEPEGLYFHLIVRPSLFAYLILLGLLLIWCIVDCVMSRPKKETSSTVS